MRVSVFVALLILFLRYVRATLSLTSISINSIFFSSGLFFSDVLAIEMLGSKLPSKI